jgi:hypothetical protein
MWCEVRPRQLLGASEDTDQPIAMAPPISRAATARRMPASRPAIIVFRRLTFLEEPFPAQKVARHAAQFI